MRVWDRSKLQEWKQISRHDDFKQTVQNMRVSTMCPPSPPMIPPSVKNNTNYSSFHLYSEPRDPLGEAIKNEATKNRLETVMLSLDSKKDPTLDLSSHESFTTMKADVERGEWDYVHAGFPRCSFSMARHYKVPG